MSVIDVVVAQSPAELDGPDERVDWLRQALKLESISGADLIVLPELFLSGYNIGAKVQHWAEPFDGAQAQAIAELCRQHEIAIHFGYPERFEGQVYNSACCYGKEGHRLGGHRKLVLPPGYEGDYFVSGNNIEFFEINGLKIATLICYDAEFPETVRHVAQRGAEIVLVPTALSSQWAVVANNVIPTRAFENGVFVCYANHAGSENGTQYLGSSCIIDADGSELKRAGSEPEFLRAVLRKEQVHKAQARLPYLQDMQQLPTSMASAHWPES